MSELQTDGVETTPAAAAQNGGGSLISGAQNAAQSDGGGISGDGLQQPAQTQPQGTTQGFKGLGIYGEDGRPSEEFLNGLPDKYKGLKSLFTKYNGDDALLQGIANLQYIAGQKALEPLPEDATDQQKQERAALMRKLNQVPEKVEDYGINKPDNLPEGVEWNDEEVNGFLGILHKYNAPPALVKELVDADIARAARGLDGAYAQQAQMLQAEGEKLKQEFGPKLDAIKLDAVRMAKTLGIDPATSKLFSTAEGVKAFAQMKALVSETKLVNPDGNPSSGASFLEQANEAASKAADAYARGDTAAGERYYAEQQRLNQMYLRTRK